MQREGWKGSLIYIIAFDILYKLETLKGSFHITNP